MTRPSKKSYKSPQRGMALLMAVVGLLLISAMVAGMIVLTNTETNISSNYKDEQSAFFAAKAGIEEARDRMQTGVTDTLTASLPTTLPGTTGSVLYILNPANSETVAPWKGSSSTSYPDDEICKETTTITCSGGLPSLTSCSGWCASTTASSVYSASPTFLWKWVRVTLKQNNALSAYPTNGNSASTAQTCWNGTNEVATGTACSTSTPNNLPVYTLTALAVTPSGSRRMVQTEIAEDRLSFNAPSALTMDGGSLTANTANSNNYNIQGTDTAGCGGAATSAQVAAVGVVTNPDVATFTNAIPNGRRNNYQGVGGTNPDVENVSSSLPSSLQTVSGLQTLMSTVKASVTQPVITGPHSGIASPGTSGHPQIIYVNGDLTISGNTTGYGILAVTGTLTVSGNVGWNGLVLVVGKGSIVGNGGGNNQYNGAILVAKTLDNSGNVLSSLGAPNYDWNGGGGNGIYYSTGCIAQATQLTTFHVNVLRELLN